MGPALQAVRVRGGENGHDEEDGTCRRRVQTCNGRQKAPLDQWTGGMLPPLLTEHLDPERAARRDARGHEVASAGHAIEHLDRHAPRQRRARDAADELGDDVAEGAQRGHPSRGPDPELWFVWRLWTSNKVGGDPKRPSKFTVTAGFRWLPLVLKSM